MIILLCGWLLVIFWKDCPALKGSCNEIFNIHLGKKEQILKPSKATDLRNHNYVRQHSFLLCKANYSTTSPFDAGSEEEIRI